MKEVFDFAKGKMPYEKAGAEPMKFIAEKNDGDKFEYTFENVETGEQRTVVQYA